SIAEAARLLSVAGSSARRRFTLSVLPSPASGGEGLCNNVAADDSADGLAFTDGFMGRMTRGFCCMENRKSKKRVKQHTKPPRLCVFFPGRKLALFVPGGEFVVPFFPPRGAGWWAPDQGGRVRIFPFYTVSGKKAKNFFNKHVQRRGHSTQSSKHCPLMPGI